MSDNIDPRAEGERKGPVFKGEGEYESQWDAWDDGYCQGLEYAAKVADAEHEERKAKIQKGAERVQVMPPADRQEVEEANDRARRERRYN